MKFKIKHFCDELYYRPKISSKACLYFEKWVINSVIQPYKLFTRSKWDHELGVIFKIKDDFGNIVVLPSNKYKAENIQSWTVLIPIKNFDDAEHPYEIYAHLIFTAIKNYLIDNQKKITATEIDPLWNTIDLDFLNCLPYPAPFEEQKYVGDDNPIVKKIYLDKFGV